MIDSFALLLTHGLMLIAAWRLLSRPDLDREGDLPPSDGPRIPGKPGRGPGRRDA